VRKLIRDRQFLVRETFLWSNYSFGDPMVIIIIITPSSQKLKMSRIGTAKLAIHTAIVAYKERGLRGCASLGRD